MNLLERRFALISKLFAKEQETTENLANELNVSIRTVQRDIEYLSYIYPISTKPGKYGGVSIFPGCKGNMILFTNAQANVFIKTISFIKHEAFFHFNSEEIQCLEEIAKIYIKDDTKKVS